MEKQREERVNTAQCVTLRSMSSLHFSLCQHTLWSALERSPSLGPCVSSLGAPGLLLSVPVESRPPVTEISASFSTLHRAYIYNLTSLENLEVLSPSWNLQDARKALQRLEMWLGGV